MEAEHMYLLLNIFVLTTTSLVSGSCQYTDDTCEFSLVITNTLTMMHGKDQVFPYNGKIYRYNETDPSTAQSVPLDGVVTADGYENSRVVTVANGTLPGPPLIVYEGQTVVVNVINELLSDGVTIHWHGITQRDTPWMDGVAYITQCPIMPGQSFRYQFKATPKGTHWYHSHIGSQRNDGLFGAFIIRPRKPLEIPEHILTLTDWNHDGDSTSSVMKQAHNDFQDRIPYQTSKAADGSNFANFRFQSGLISGRGRFYDPITDKHNEAPLSIFRVDPNTDYKFRIINAGIVYPFRFSVDNHTLVAIASDGYDFEPVIVDALDIFPGERFDVLLHTSNTIENYWIRARTLEEEYNHRTLAILHYVGAPDGSGSASTEKQCSEYSPCSVLNCQAPQMPIYQHVECITINDIKSTKISSIIPPIDEEFDKTLESSSTNETFKEIFLNFGFAGIYTKPPSVNGRKFEFPGVSSLTQMDEIDERLMCENANCGLDNICTCFHSLTLDQVDIVQMVLLNMGNGQGWAHPVHIHGHSFEVLKTGYALFDENRKISAQNPDITCLGQTFDNATFCNAAKWTNPSWKNGNIPGIELQRPPIKDTIIIPSGGYVVVRIRADNPGLWIMHCHVGLHHTFGMAMVINESYANVPKAQPGFPECRSFPSSAVFPSIRQKRSAPYMFSVNSLQDDLSKTFVDVDKRLTYFWIVAVLGGIVLIQITVILYLCRTTRLKKTEKAT
ncbi:uncharacterized protein [Argopecten irradians]|uniref:uncharacterized protein n=1 Tax=Argopecten irradians TaxID=31199 RepID=UPI003723A556